METTEEKKSVVKETSEKFVNFIDDNFSTIAMIGWLTGCVALGFVALKVQCKWLAKGIVDEMTK